MFIKFLTFIQYHFYENLSLVPTLLRLNPVHINSISSLSIPLFFTCGFQRGSATFQEETSSSQTVIVLFNISIIPNSEIIKCYNVRKFNILLKYSGYTCSYSVLFKVLYVLDGRTCCTWKGIRMCIRETGC